MVDDREFIFTSSNDDSLAFDDREDAECIGHGEITRYVREDLCIEVSSEDFRIKHLPLFNVHIDQKGDVWVKSPVKI